MEEDTKARHRAEREQRLEAALRENLRRRKAQARGRRVGEEKMPGREPEAGDSGPVRRDED